MNIFIENIVFFNGSNLCQSIDHTGYDLLLLLLLDLCLSGPLKLEGFRCISTFWRGGRV